MQQKPRAASSRFTRFRATAYAIGVRDSPGVIGKQLRAR